MNQYKRCTFVECKIHGTAMGCVLCTQTMKMCVKYGSLGHFVFELLFVVVCLCHVGIHMDKIGGQDYNGHLNVSTYPDPIYKD
jgi:hypothetical protein